MRALALATLGSLLLAAAGEGAPKTTFAPRLRAELGRSLGSGPSVVLDVSQTTAERALARVTVVIPHAQPFHAPPPGTVVGDAEVAVVPSSGRNPSLLAGRLVSVRAIPAEAKGCVQAPTAAFAAALEATSTRAAVRRLTLRFFVHSRRGTTRLTACLPRRDALAGRGAVRRLAVRLERGFGPTPAGTVMWRGLFTPVGKRGGAAAYPTTTESRAFVVSPAFMTLEGPAGASVARGGRFRVRGTLTFGTSTQSRRIRVTSGTTVLGLTETRDGGAYEALVRAPVRGGPLDLQARVPSRRLRCGGRTADAPSGCTSATLAGVSSNVLRVFVR